MSERPPIDPTGEPLKATLGDAFNDDPKQKVKLEQIKINGLIAEIKDILGQLNAETKKPLEIEIADVQKEIQDNIDNPKVYSWAVEQLEEIKSNAEGTLNVSPEPDLTPNPEPKPKTQREKRETFKYPETELAWDMRDNALEAVHAAGWSSEDIAEVSKRFNELAGAVAQEEDQGKREELLDQVSAARREINAEILKRKQIDSTYAGEPHHPVPATAEDLLAGNRAREQAAAAHFSQDGVNVLPTDSEFIPMGQDMPPQEVTDEQPTPEGEKNQEEEIIQDIKEKPAGQEAVDDKEISKPEPSEGAFPQEILWDDDSTKRREALDASEAPFPYEILRDSDIKRKPPASRREKLDASEAPFPYEVLETDEGTSAPAAGAEVAAAAPSAPPTPSAPAAPERTVETVKNEIKDLQEQLGPLSAALYAARADAEQKAIKNRGWFKRQLAKGGFGGAVDPKEFDEASKDQIKKAENDYEAIASQLEQKLDERTETKIRNLSDQEIVDRIKKQRKSHARREQEYGKIKKKDGTVREEANAKTGDALTVTPQDIAKYREQIEKKLPVLKAAARFQGLYLKQATMDRQAYIDSLPPKERSKVMEVLQTAGIFMRKTRHARIIGIAALGAATGGVGYAGTAALFGARIARSYLGVTAGAVTSRYVGKMMGANIEKKVEQSKSDQTKKVIGGTAIKVAATDKKQQQAQRIVEEQDRLERRLKTKQVAAAAAAGFVAGAGTAGVMKIIEGDVMSNLPKSPDIKATTDAAIAKMFGGEAAPAKPASFIPDNQQPPEVQAVASAPDSNIKATTDAAIAKMIGNEAMPSKPAASILLEGDYKHGQSIARVIDNKLKAEYPNLSDVERSRVAYRLALQHGQEQGFHAQRGNINLVKEHDHYKVELDAAKVQAEIDRVKNVHYVEHSPINKGNFPAQESRAVSGGGRPHSWEPHTSRGQDVGRLIDNSRIALEKQFGLHDNTRFWNVMHRENIMHLKEITDSTDPTALEQFAQAKGVSVDAVRDMVNRIDALSRSGKTPIGPLDTPESLLERAAQVRAGHFVDKAPSKTLEWVSTKPAAPTPAPAVQTAPVVPQTPTPSLEGVPEPIKSQFEYVPQGASHVTKVYPDGTVVETNTINEAGSHSSRFGMQRTITHPAGISRSGSVEDPRLAAIQEQRQAVRRGNYGSGRRTFGYWGGNYPLNGVRGPHGQIYHEKVYHHGSVGIRAKIKF